MAKCGTRKVRYRDRIAGSWWHLLLEAEPEPRLNMLSALLRGFRG